MKIKIFMEADRLTVAAILVKNGYTVRQGKEKRTSTGKSYDYYLETLDDENAGREDDKE
ncbi:hypothetical protein [Calorimonas adulescens]|uniref:hypothetical protein n=1 Tax=Calorimonas adulescens TaxID=2606906 RepID=UPI001396C349|nr:hypothetical protein [Calorimonas adulescens]